MVADMARERPSAVTAELIKPSIDEQQYRLVQLQNGLKALLIHDEDTDKAAAAMDVRIGSMSDPADLPGLAHFTEHMLFYASERYPTEDEYSKFVADHGGSTNAYTAGESTNYHFDVNQEHLAPALDRFAQFFICPLISEDGVEREVKAVDSEHSKNLNSDPWRKLQLWRHTSNPRHPFSKFATGSYETLMTQPKAGGIVVHERVREFAARHYSANVMRLVVYGRSSLDELEALVREKFAGVQNRQLTPPAFTGDALTEAEVGRLIRMVPEKDGHRVEVQWLVPSEAALYKQLPSQYIGHLLGHEGEGSAFAALKARGWATSLCAGDGGSSFSARSFFICSLDLTNEGHEHLEEALSIVFAYIALVRGPGGVSPEVYEEMRALSALRFNFRDKQAPYSVAQSLAQAMQLYEDRDILLGAYSVPQEYDAGAIRAVLAEMTPANARVMWASKDFKGETDDVEPWYKTEFSNKPLPTAWLQAWEGAEASSWGLHLPEHNPYIATDFNLLEASEAEQQPPQVVHESPMVRLWHRPDTSFRMPKAVLVLGFQCPEGYTSPEAAVLTRIYTKLLSDYLNEVAYPASLAGLKYSVHNTASGFELSASGYSHKLMLLVHRILDEIVNFEVRDDRFEVQREAAAKEYRNMKYDQPYQHAIYTSSMLLELKRWHICEYEAVVDELTPAQLRAFFPRLMSRCFVEALATGNLPTADAVKLVSSVESLLSGCLGAKQVFPSQRPDKRVVALRCGQPALKVEAGPNPANDNSAAVLLYQVGPDDLRRNVLSELLVQLAKRDAFHQLRTVEQLGYMVFMSAWSTLSVRIVAFILQSGQFPAAHLEARVEAFVAGFAARVSELSDEEFVEQVEELAKSKLEAPKRLGQVAQRNWREIDDGTHVFDRPQQETAVLRRLAKAELQAFFQEVLADPKTRKKLSIQVRAAGGAEAPAQPNGAPAAVNGSAAGAEAPENGEQFSAVSEAASAAVTAGKDGQPAEAGVKESGSAAANGATAGKGGGEVPVHVIEDVWEFKRKQEVFPSPK